MPVLALEPSDAAAECQARNPGVRDDPARCREPERLRRAVKLTPQRSRLRARGARLRIDANALHQAEVDDDGAIANRQARKAVTPTADGDLKVRAPREPHSRNHVRRPGAARDQRGATVDRTVPDLAALVIDRIPGAHELSAEGSLQLPHRGLIELGTDSDCSHADCPPEDLDGSRFTGTPSRSTIARSANAWGRKPLHRSRARCRTRFASYAGIRTSWHGSCTGRASPPRAATASGRERASRRQTRDARSGRQASVLTRAQSLSLPGANATASGAEGQHAKPTCPRRGFLGHERPIGRQHGA